MPHFCLFQNKNLIFSWLCLGDPVFEDLTLPMLLLFTGNLLRDGTIEQNQTLVDKECWWHQLWGIRWILQKSDQWLGRTFGCQTLLCWRSTWIQSHSFCSKTSPIRSLWKQETEELHQVVRPTCIHHGELWRNYAWMAQLRQRYEIVFINVRVLLKS